MALPLNHDSELHALCVAQAAQLANVAATVKALKAGGWQAGKARYATLSIEERQLVKAALEAANAARDEGANVEDAETLAA